MWLLPLKKPQVKYLKVSACVTLLSDVLSFRAFVGEEAVKIFI